MKNIVYLKNFDGEFYCPVTGKMILSPELFEGPSDATVCVYVSICDEFEYSVNGFEDVFNEFLEEDYDKIEDVFEKTRKKLKMDKVVFFCFQN